MSGVGYGSVNKTVLSAKYHMIWCPRYSKRVLVGEVEACLKQMIGEVADEHACVVIAVEVIPDHVHLLVEIPPAVPLSPFVGPVKGRSSRLLRRAFPPPRRLPSRWSPSWFVSTVGGAPLEVVRRDVKIQKRVA